MKKTTFSNPLLLASAMLIFLFACGKESSPGDNGTSISNENIEVPSSFTKKVVVEKYTGEWCGNCVFSGMFFDDYKDNDHFIGVGIHVGGNLQPDRYMNDASIDLANHLISVLAESGSGEPAYPNVIFDRTANSTGQIHSSYTFRDWDDVFSDHVSREVDCGLRIESAVEGGQLSGTIRYALSAPLPGSPAVTVYLVEHDLDGSEQKSAPDPDNYRHSGVLRNIMTPLSGTSIDGTATSQVMSFDLGAVDVSDYNVGNLEIVAFIHETGPERLNRKIINGQKAKVGTTQDFD